MDQEKWRKKHTHRNGEVTSAISAPLSVVCVRDLCGAHRRLLSRVPICSKQICLSFRSDGVIARQIWHCELLFCLFNDSKWNDDARGLNWMKLIYQTPSAACHWPRLIDVCSKTQHICSQQTIRDKCSCRLSRYINNSIRFPQKRERAMNTSSIAAMHTEQSLWREPLHINLSNIFFCFSD